MNSGSRQRCFGQKTAYRIDSALYFALLISSVDSSTMPTLSILQRSLIAIVLLILALVFSIPWGLYYLGLKDIDGKARLTGTHDLR
jgi:hypothetical protein